MSTKPAVVRQPCPEVAMKIGNTIGAMEVLQRQPPSPLYASCVNTLAKQLESLGNEYNGNDCDKS
jgi:hypothetical protein